MRPDASVGPEAGVWSVFTALPDRFGGAHAAVVIRG
jgi:hypothetical protein